MSRQRRLALRAALMVGTFLLASMSFAAAADVPPPISLSIDEGIGASNSVDSALAPAPIVLTIDEGIGASDSPGSTLGARPIALSADETVGASDQTTLRTAIQLANDEGIGVSDALSILRGIELSISDGASVTDAVAILPAARLPIDDGAAVSDTVSIALGRQPDSTPPTITLTTPPEGAVYLLNQRVKADYACQDESGGSGLASCVGTVANGTAIDTATVGVKTFAVAAVDNTRNTSSLTHHYSVDYTFSGLLPPVRNPGMVNIGKAGKGYPIKWQLRDANGHFVDALGAVADITFKSTSCSAFTSDATGASEARATRGGRLRYEIRANQYIFNWASPSAKGCYTLFLQLDSGQTNFAYFNLSKKRTN